MIEIQLTTAVVLYAAVLGALMGSVWLFTEFSVRRTQKTLEKQHLWRCVFCGYTYLDEGAMEVSQCPRCESFNSMTDKHARFVRARSRRRREEPEEDAPSTRRNPSHRKRPHQRRRGPRRH